MIVEARFKRKEGGNILEEEIVLRLNRGDPAALEALIDCYAPLSVGWRPVFYPAAQRNGRNWRATCFWPPGTTGKSSGQGR